MTLLIDANPVPLRADSDGAVRVAGTRLTLDTIVAAYRDGASPEAIVKRFPGLSLQDAYAVIGYYLRNREGVDAYLGTRRREAEDLRRQVEEAPSRPFSRDELLTRRGEK